MLPNKGEKICCSNMAALAMPRDGGPFNAHVGYVYEPQQPAGKSVKTYKLALFSVSL